MKNTFSVRVDADANALRAAAQGISLQDLAHINEDIKSVVELSRSIGLGAINAGLIAHKCNSGSGARGFGVAATELRLFSNKLEAVMHTMEEAVFREIGAAARLRKLVRRRNALAAAENKSACGMLFDHIADLDAEILHGRGEQANWRKELLAMLRCAELNAKSGHVNARVARLEAVSGGSLAATMTMAAAGIEEQVLQVLGIVKKLFLQVGYG